MEEPGSKRVPEEDGRKVRGRFGGQVELSVINSEIEYYIYGNTANREKVGKNQEGSKDRTLRHTRGEGGKSGIKRFLAGQI